MAPDSDSLHRFLFERPLVRGEIVHLDAAWQAVLERHPYPPVVQRPLGEALAAVVLLTATLKLDGALLLQVRGEGPLRTLVAQATHRRTLRGLARWHGTLPAAPAPELKALFGDGQLVLTIDPRDGRRHQGIVPLAGPSLGSALEGYFDASEQLPTRLRLAVDGRRAAGLLLQRLPGIPIDGDGWNRTALLADTVTDAELLGLPVRDLLTRLFHEEDLRLFEPEPVAFRCGCSRERIAETLRALGRSEVEAIVAEQGSVQVTCEFCNRDYGFDAVDARELFSSSVPTGGSGVRH
jgi:molecular chaperone Hsp33